MDWIEGVVIAVVAAAVFALGIITGADAYDNSWKQDCEALGMHRSGKTDVYICSKR